MTSPSDSVPMKSNDLDLLTRQLEDAMQFVWNDWCTDTHTHPEFIRHEGRELVADFKGARFTRQVAEYLLSRMDRDKQESAVAPLPPDSGPLVVPVKGSSFVEVIPPPPDSGEREHKPCECGQCKSRRRFYSAAPLPEGEPTERVCDYCGGPSIGWMYAHRPGCQSRPAMPIVEGEPIEKLLDKLIEIAPLARVDKRQYGEKRDALHAEILTLYQRQQEELERAKEGWARVTRLWYEESTAQAEEIRKLREENERLGVYNRSFQSEIETQKKAVQWGVDENTFLREEIRKLKEERDGRLANFLTPADDALIIEYFQAICAYHGEQDWPIEEMSLRAVRMEDARAALWYRFAALRASQENG